MHGRGEGELTTRQNVQLHYIRLDALPDVFDRLHAAGLTSAGACGDTVRNITGCPVGGLAHDELFDPTPVLEEAAKFFYGNPDYSDLPRKHKIAITACPDACSAPEINCIALIGAIRDGEEGFGVLVGGGLSSVPRIAKDLGIWVPKDDAVTLLAAILDEWREDLRYRVSRVKSRLKFMIDDLGPEGCASVSRRVSAARSSASSCRTLPPASNHLGVHAQSDGRHYVGVPVHLGLVERRADGRTRRPGREPRRRRALHAPAEPRAHERRSRAARRSRRAGSRRSACRSMPARCAAMRSPAPASRTATSRSPRQSRAWTGSCSSSRSASTRTPTGCA